MGLAMISIQDLEPPLEDLSALLSHYTVDSTYAHIPHRCLSILLDSPL